MPSNDVPSIHKNVALMEDNSKGSRSGNDNTGYKVPFELALDINAAIMVSTAESPRLPSKTHNTNNAKLFITRLVITIYKNIINIFKTKVSEILNRSFPRNTELEPLTSFNSKDVPRSSSETNTLDRPLDVAKKMIIHSIPALISFESFSSPTENLITEITTITNISSELTA